MISDVSTDRIRAVAHSLVARRGWFLFECFDLGVGWPEFVSRVTEALGGSLMLQDYPGINDARIERATVHEYSLLLHATVAQRDTPAGARALIEIWNYVTPLIRKIVRDDDLAHDVAMDVLIKVCEKRDQVHDPGCFLSWAGVIARRAAIRAAQRAGREIPASALMPVGGEGAEGDEGDAEAYLDRLQRERAGPAPPELNGVLRRAELETRIRYCLRRMRHGAEVFIGLALCELPVSEIAQQLGMKANAVYVIFHRARKRLQGCGPLLADLGVALGAQP